jgi:hypothetical protein
VLQRGSLPPEEPEEAYGIYVGDLRLAVSREPLGKFQRIQNSRAVVTRGERNEWDSGFLVVNGGGIIEHNDQIYIYYSGVDERGATDFPAGIVPGPIMTGLASLPRDGFTFLRAQDPLTRGTMTTRPIQVKSPARARLSVNVSHAMLWRDWITVEVLDARTSKPIPGYSRKDAVGVMADGPRRSVRWREHRTLAAVGVPQIRLRFHFYGQARLYSFTFKTA